MRDIFICYIPVLFLTLMLCVGCENPNGPNTNGDDTGYDTLYVKDTKLYCTVEYHNNMPEMDYMWTVGIYAFDKNGISCPYVCLWYTASVDFLYIDEGVYNVAGYSWQIQDYSRGKQMMVLPIVHGFDSGDENRAMGGTVNVMKRVNNYYEIELKLKFRNNGRKYILFKGFIESKYEEY